MFIIIENISYIFVIKFPFLIRKYNHGVIGYPNYYIVILWQILYHKIHYIMELECSFYPNIHKKFLGES